MSKQKKLDKSVLAIAWVLVFGAMAPMLDSTMVNIAIHSLSQDLHSSMSTVQWTITGYVLATGIAVPFSGWLLNKFDGKNVFLAGEIGFAIGSVAAALSPNIQFLIGARLVQGFAGGLIIPLLTTLLVQTAGAEVMGQMMATVGLPIILGPLVGPILGGIIIRYLSWQWIFWVNVPVAIIAIGLIIMKLPKFPAQNKSAKIDLVGILLLGGATSTIIYGVVEASKTASFNNQTTLLYIAAGIIMLILYVGWAVYKRADAVVPLELFKYRSFNGSMLGLMISGTLLNGAMLLLPLFFQNIAGMSVMMAGFALIPQGVGMLVSRSITGRLTDQIGAKYVVFVSALITFAGTIPFYWIDKSTSYWIVAIVLFIRGIGAGGILSPLMTDSYTGMNRVQIPAASIGSRIIQNIGSAFGSALITTAVMSYSNSQVNNFKDNLRNGHYHVQPEQMKAFRLQHMQIIQLHSFQFGFLVISIAALVILIPTILLTNKRKN